jgi:hypothetical protein
MDYGRRKYASPSECQTGFMSEVTEQYTNSIGGDLSSRTDLKQPYQFDNYQEMMYLFNGVAVSPYLNDRRNVLDKPYVPTPPSPPGYPDIPYPEVYPPYIPITPIAIRYPGGDLPRLPELDLPPTEILKTCIELFDILYKTLTLADYYKALEDYNAAKCSGTYIDQGCASATIGYTTTQMSVGESQQLYVVGEFHDGFVFGMVDWEVTGGGTISDEGFFTAAADNAECANNSTVKLICYGKVVATLDIAVNAVETNADAYATMGQGLCYQNLIGPPTTCVYCEGLFNIFRCDGTQPSVTSCINNKGTYKIYCWATNGGTPVTCTACTNNTDGCALFGMHIGDILDLRTTAMKTAGCCPAELL